MSGKLTFDLIKRLKLKLHINSKGEVRVSRRTKRGSWSRKIRG